MLLMVILLGAYKALAHEPGNNQSRRIDVHLSFIGFAQNKGCTFAGKCLQVRFAFTFGVSDLTVGCASPHLTE
jgi:hypothetical protein